MNRRRRRTVRPRPLPVHDQDHIHTTSACRKLCSILFHHALGDSGAVCSCLLACRNLRTFALSKVVLCKVSGRLLEDRDTCQADRPGGTRLDTRRLSEYKTLWSGCLEGCLNLSYP